MLSGILGFLYPLFMIIIDLKNDDSMILKRYISYWVIFSFLILFDTPIHYILSFVPLYYLTKVIKIILDNIFHISFLKLML